MARPRDPEAGHTNTAVVGHEEVVGRDVSMNDLQRLTVGGQSFVCRMQALASLRDDVDRQRCAPGGRHPVE